MEFSNLDDIIKFESQKYTNIYFNDINKIPNEEEFNTKCEEVKTNIGLYKLREHRNRLLTESDWVMMRDVKLENINEWEIYRQALRDLPNTQTDLKTDIIGNLLNVKYPTKPQK